MNKHDEIKEQARQFLEEHWDEFDTFEKVKDKVEMILQKESLMNDVRRECTAWSTFVDMRVLFRFPAIHNEMYDGYINIDNQLLEMWGVALDQVIEAAVNNLRNREWKVMRFEEVFRERLKVELNLSNEEIDDMIGADEDMLVARIITNAERRFGGVAIMNAFVVEAAADQMRGSFWAVPSSVHEWIIFPHTNEASLWKHGLHSSSRVI